MSGRKAKAARRDRQAQRRREVERNGALVARHVENFSCSTGAADDAAGRCHERLGDLDFDIDLTTAILDMWRRTHPDHPIVPPLEALVAEQQRHVRALEEILARLAPYWGKDATAHAHADPNRDDVYRIGNIIIGDDLPEVLPEIDGQIHTE